MASNWGGSAVLTMSIFMNRPIIPGRRRPPPARSSPPPTMGEKSLFAAGTTNGDLIRGRIPTTYRRTKPSA